MNTINPNVRDNRYTGWNVAGSTLKPGLSDTSEQNITDSFSKHEPVEERPKMYAGDFDVRNRKKTRSSKSSDDARKMYAMTTMPFVMGMYATMGLPGLLVGATAFQMGQNMLPK